MKTLTSKRRPVSKRSESESEFRKIDLTFLELARRRAVPIKRGRAEATVELVLPVWGVTNFPSANSIRLGNLMSGGFIDAPLDSMFTFYINRILSNASGANGDELRRVFQNEGDAWNFRLRADCPVPPVEVRRNIERVRHKFDDVFIAFEADWREDVSVPLDPLVIGVKTKTEKYETTNYKGKTVEAERRFITDSFLIAVYDPTKLEHYVASEFTTL